MTVEQMHKGGEITQQMSFTDEELAQALKTTQLALAYLEGKGQGWSLAVVPLRHEVEQFERFVAARKRK